MIIRVLLGHGTSEHPYKYAPRHNSKLGIEPIKSIGRLIEIVYIILFYYYKRNRP